MADVAVMLADGREAIADIDVLRHQDGVLGSVASAPTVWRTLDEVTGVRLKKIQAARARVRRHVWTQVVERHGGIPASRVAGRLLPWRRRWAPPGTALYHHGEALRAAPRHALARL